MYASVLIDEVEQDLLDDDNDRWSADEHLANLNASEKLLVYLLPTAFVTTGVYQLVAGSRQSLPDGSSSYPNPSAVDLPQAIELVNITRNMGTDGATPGNAIVPIDKEVLDQMLPNWHAYTADDEIDHCVMDPRDKNKFWVFPPQPDTGMGWVEAVYSSVPPDIEKSGESYDVNINLDDIYAEPLKHCMKFKAYLKDAANSAHDAERALGEWNMFVVLIGRKDLIEKNYSSLRKYYGNSNQNVSQ